MIEFNATFIVAMLSFVVFIFIMNAIFYNPILSIIRKREDFVGKNYEDAKRFEQVANENNDIYSSKISQTQEKCRHEIKSHVSRAQAEASDKVKGARESFKASVQEKKDNIIAEGNKLKDTVKSTVVKDLASSIVSKFLGKDSTIDVVDYEQVSKVMD